ncbi:MAG: hypothetical protein IKC14_06160 [Kiritimatiellae bacterium]|nr:hypothetical protein [Kiritimatiellia bacterium]
MKGTATFTRLLDRTAHLVPICVGLGFVLYGGGKQRGIPGAPMAFVLEDPPVSSVVTNSAIACWNRRGAWDDSFRLDFGDGWVFPWGSNHLSSVEVLSCGEVWPRWDDTNRIAALDVPLAIVPGLTHFSCERTADDSYVLSWTNAAPNRSTNVLASAAIELRRCGDRVVTQDGVASAAARELPFPRFGWGQDEEWVEHYFTNDFAAIESVGYTNWVDGIALEPGNGFYKLTVTLSNAPPETVNLTVGEYSVAVTNAGNYVFLLEKGVRYPIGFSFLPEGVAYSFDDGGPAEPPEPDWPEPPGQSRGAPQDVYYYTYSTTGDYGHGQELVIPTKNGNGYACYWPSLSIYSYSAIDGILLPNTMFAAIVHDIPAGEFPVVAWKSYGSVIERGTFFLVSDSHSSWEELDVVAEYCGVELRGKITLERHVRETGIGLEGGGVVFVEGPHLDVNGEPVPASSQAEASLDLWWALTSPGTLRLESSCGGSASARVRESNDPVSLPLEWHADAYTSGISNLIVSVSGAQTNGQFIFTLEFDDDRIDPIATTTSLAVVELEVEAVATWPTNRNRHVFGPKERFRIVSSPQVLLSIDSASPASVSGNTVTAPDVPCTFPVTATIGSAAVSLLFSCIPPTGIDAYSCFELSQQDWLMRTGTAPFLGDVAVGIKIENRLMPDYVSFSHLFFMEGECDATDRWGLFADPQNTLLPHDSIGGAWGEVSVGIVNDLPKDYATARFNAVLPIEMDGGFQYNITNYWYVKNSGVTGEIHPFGVEAQKYTLYANGDLSVEKFGWTATRGTNNVTTITRSQ